MNSKSLEAGALEAELEQARSQVESTRESKDWWHKKAAGSENSTLYSVAARKAEEAWLAAVARVDSLLAQSAADSTASGAPAQNEHEADDQRPALSAALASPTHDSRGLQSAPGSGGLGSASSARSVGGRSRGSKGTATWQSVLEDCVADLRHGSTAAQGASDTAGDTGSTPRRRRSLYSGYAASVAQSYATHCGVRSINGYSYFGDSHSLVQPWTSPMDEPGSPSRRWRDIDTASRGTLYRNSMGSLTAEGMRIVALQAREVARERELATEMAREGTLRHEP